MTATVPEMDVTSTEAPTAADARQQREAARLRVARELMVNALASPTRPVAEQIARTARAANVADEWAADVYWQLVRLRILSPEGGPGPRLRPAD